MPTPISGLYMGKANTYLSPQNSKADTACKRQALTLDSVLRIKSLSIKCSVFAHEVMLSLKFNLKYTGHLETKILSELFRLFCKMCLASPVPLNVNELLETALSEYSISSQLQSKQAQVWA